MKEFEVKIQEVLERIVTVTADSREQALEKVEAMWLDSDIVLDSNDFVDVDYEIEKERDIEQAEIDIILVKPEERAVKTKIKNELNAFQSIVEGYVEIIRPFNDNVAIILNEEGKLNYLQPNRGLRDDNNKLYDIIVGNFIVVGLNGNKFCSLTDSQLEKYIKKFEKPEVFIRKGDRICVLPVQNYISNKKIDRDAR